MKTFEQYWEESGVVMPSPESDPQQNETLNYLFKLAAENAWDSAQIEMMSDQLDKPGCVHVWRFRDEKKPYFQCNGCGETMAYEFQPTNFNQEES